MFLKIWFIFCNPACIVTKNTTGRHQQYSTITPYVPMDFITPYQTAPHDENVIKADTMLQ